MKTIAGNLVKPNSDAIVDATVRFISTSNTTNGALRGTMFEFTTQADGAYSTKVLPGSYKVEFKQLVAGVDEDSLDKDIENTKYITLGHTTIPVYAQDLPENKEVVDNFTIVYTLVSEHEVVTTPTIGTCAMVVGTVYTIISVGDTDFTAVGASNNNINTDFTYAVGTTGAASGSGTVSYVLTTTDNIVTTNNLYASVTITGGAMDVDGYGVYTHSSLTGTLAVPTYTSPDTLTFDKSTVSGTYGTFVLNNGNMAGDGQWTYTPYINEELPLEDLGIS